jgi:Uma2 family endonuclease
MSSKVIIQPPRTMMEVFKSLPEGTLVQLIENNLITSPSPKDRHQEILEEITFQLTTYVRSKKLGKVRFAPYDVYLDQKNAFQPDLIFISSENLYKIEENGLHGAPDLVIEILSPATAKYDQKKKKAVYERCGVKDYWMVDPATKTVTGFALRDKKFVELDTATAVIVSPLLHTTFNF